MALVCSDDQAVRDGEGPAARRTRRRDKESEPVNSPRVRWSTHADVTAYRVAYRSVHRTHLEGSLQARTAFAEV